MSQLKIKTYSTVASAQEKQGVLSQIQSCVAAWLGCSILRTVVKIQQRERETTVNSQSVS